MTNIIVQILLTFGAALICSLILIPIIIKLSIKLNLVDKPNERKCIKRPYHGWAVWLFLQVPCWQYY